MSKGWFIVNAQSGKEEVLQTLIEARRKSGELSFIEEVFIPKHREVVFKSGKKKTVDKRSYPGYVYVNMEMNLENKKEVLSLPHVICFVQEDSRAVPDPLPESNYVGIVNKEEGVDVDDSFVVIDFDVNDKVMIIDGALNGFIGRVGSVLKDKKKLMVDVEIFGRITPVEIDYFKVKKV